MVPVNRPGEPLRHLLLLWHLRLRLALGALPKGLGGVPALAGVAFLLTASAAVAAATAALFRTQAIADDATLRLFLLLLTGFLAGTLWITWPVVTAGVDDAAELSRFALFPIASDRLFLASAVAGLFEARTLPLWGALSGAAWTMHDQYGAGLMTCAAATLLLGAVGVVWGRVGLHLMLNLLQNRRSAEAMGAGLMLTLGLSALVPPPDLSWLEQVSSTAAKLDLRLLAGGLIVFSMLPTGAWAWMVFGSAEGRPLVVAVAAIHLVAALLVGHVTALLLLDRFHRKAGRALPQRVDSGQRRRVFRWSDLDRVLVERELRDALLNPRVRMMLALPFFLTVLLKLVGALSLATALLGPQGDAWLLIGLASYGALVLAAGLAQNAFGYDGPGVSLLLAAPVETRRILIAKNIAHGLLALTSSAGVTLFAALYLGAASGWALALVGPNALFQTLLLLSMGNLQSVLEPRRFHASLKRRDKVGPASVAIGLLTAAVAVLPAGALLRAWRPQTPPTWTLAAAWLLPLGGFALWQRSTALATRLLETRRPELVRAVTRQ